MRKSTLFAEELWRCITIDLKKTELVTKNELRYNSILRTGKAWKYYCFASRICKLAVLAYFLCFTKYVWTYVFFFFLRDLSFLLHEIYHHIDLCVKRNTDKYFLFSRFLKLKKSHSNRKIELRRKWCTGYRRVEWNMI